MPALTGQVISTITDAQGQAVVVVTWFYNPATLVLRNNTVQWVSPDGQVFPIGAGALIAVNLSGLALRMRINDETGALVRQVQIPVGGRALTALQLRNAPAPDGPYNLSTDLNGITFDLA